MFGFDQGKHPMRFAVAASTVSGLLVVLVTTAAERVFRSWISWHSFLLWPLVLGWALVALLLIRRARRQERGPRRVFLIVAAFTQKHWVAQLIRELHENLERRGYDMVLKVPDRDYSGVSQVRLLEGILRRRNDYAGGFIMVNEADVIRADLARFCREAGMPVVFVDAEPFETENAYPPGTAFVGCDDGEIGAAAARWVASKLRRERIKRPVVLVIHGVRYQQREHTFQKLLESEIPGVQLIGDCARFDRGQAREVARTHLRRLEATGGKLHAVFCTNDEMALGVSDALLHVSNLPWARDTVVAGVDGTPDARAQIEAGPGPLRATVVQDSSKVAEAAVGLIGKMIRKERVPIRTSVAVEILARD
jgi:ribose transport system substrate-binding protein